MEESMIPMVTPKGISGKIKRFCETISTEIKPVYTDVVTYDKGGSREMFSKC